jgi:hypothetical protein
MTHLQCECSRRCADEDERIVNVGRVLVLNNPPCNVQLQPLQQSQPPPPAPRRTRSGAEHSTRPLRSVSVYNNMRLGNARVAACAARVTGHQRTPTPTTGSWQGCVHAQRRVACPKGGKGGARRPPSDTNVDGPVNGTRQSAYPVQGLGFVLRVNFRAQVSG